jgi:hypothetical protein
MSMSLILMITHMSFGQVDGGENSVKWPQTAGFDSHHRVLMTQSRDMGNHQL